MKTTIGGDRLGSGGKNITETTHYNRSTHDLSYVWRSSTSAGTLVPFMSQLALPGDSWDIELGCDVMTLPTLGPLFGSYKVQLDVFEVPIRLYQGKLHMNLLNIGMNMSEIYLPQMTLQADTIIKTPENDAQINTSCLLSYLGIRGLGLPDNPNENYTQRTFQAVPLLAYYDIFKCYYANKQEDDAYVIHNAMDTPNYGQIYRFDLYDTTDNLYVGDLVNNDLNLNPYHNYRAQIYVAIPQEFWYQNPKFNLDQKFIENQSNVAESINYYWDNVNVNYSGIIYAIITCDIYQPAERPTLLHTLTNRDLLFTQNTLLNNMPKLVKFPLENIDTMRKLILADVMSNTPFSVTDQNQLTPYSMLFAANEGGYSKQSSQEGLLVKTYQSDLFNNWIQTEWIDGPNGISEVTRVSTTNDYFTIDSLNLASKVYAMLNQVAISGGSYDDWLDAVYTHERAKAIENPVYQGSLIKELMFQEVVSNATSEQSGELQPLGTLGGRGKLTDKHKGGKIIIKTNEPSYIIGIFSLTPRIDYSQGNNWDMNLQNLNDFHKPALDQIAYQDLITDQLAWWDTKIKQHPVGTYTPEYKSLGKQPAWLNYMTNVNKTYGNFAQANSMFMTLNRRYEPSIENEMIEGILDATTYIDPVKFNQIFAQTDLTAQNFWVQIGAHITCRRKMSAKQIPNL